MPSMRVQSHNNGSIYYITLTIHRWYYLFDRYNRWNILSDSLQYCMKEKQLKLYGFVFMLNHLHLIIQSKDTGGFLRDFKKYTSKEFKRNIEKYESNILNLFKNSDGAYQFWQTTNMPVVIESKKFYLQKLNYMYFNPVRKQYVLKLEDWYWSSANRNCVLKPNANI